MSLRATKSPLVATLLLAGCLAGCGPAAKKPADSDIAAYLGQSQPTWLRVGNVKTAFEAVKAPEGAWRVSVDYTLHAAEDLYAPLPEFREQKLSFDQAVSKFEAFRADRIAYAEQLGFRAGLMRQGDVAPEPDAPVGVVTHAGQDLADHVTLLAQPDGSGWKFFQADAQTLGDDQIGAPLATLRAGAPHTRFVMAGTQEERDAHNRMLVYLGKLASGPAP